jgi:hypothetical protein
MGDDFTPAPGVKRKSEKKASEKASTQRQRQEISSFRREGGWPARRTRAFLTMISLFVNQKKLRRKPPCSFGLSATN